MVYFGYEKLLKLSGVVAMYNYYYYYAVEFLTKLI